MAVFNEGYVVDVQYMRTFFKELAPAWLDYVCLINGAEPPPGSMLGRGEGAGFTYCDLGCGPGVTTNLLAAANPAGEFHGIDFNPQHIAFAQKIANEGGVRNVRFHEASFEDALKREWPQFDYVVLHGVYSWISTRNKANVMEFLRRNLKVGGVVYVSYNTMPGWAALSPFQNFTQEFGSKIQGDSLKKVRDAVGYFQALKDANAQVFAANSNLATHLEGIDRNAPEYLAHEYLNQDWRPLYCTEMMKDAASAGLAFVGSATLIDNHWAYILTEPMREQVVKLPTRDLRELVKDYCTNQGFRRDVYVRAGQALTPQGREAALQRMTFALELPAARVQMRARVPVGQIAYDNEFTKAIVGALADGPKPLRELVSLPALAGKDVGDVIKNLQVLCVAAQVRPVSMPDMSARGAVNALSKAIRSRAIGPEQISQLPSTYGTAFMVNGMDQFLIDVPAGVSETEAAQMVYAKLDPARQRIVMQGKPIDEQSVAINRITEQFRDFREFRLPWLQGLGVIN